MEKIRLYAVWDRKSERYDTPWFALGDVHAKRRFIMLCNEKETVFSKFSKDFELYRLADFNLLDGEIEKEKKLMIDGQQVIKEEEKNA